MFVVMCVIDQPEDLKPVLKIWQQNGIRGVTIIESTGLHRFSRQPHIPMRYAYSGGTSEWGNYTLLTVVESEEDIQRCLRLAEEVVGDFNGPNTGIFVSWPVGFAKGVAP